MTLAHAPRLAWLNPERLGVRLQTRVRSLAYVSLWIAVFGVIFVESAFGLPGLGRLMAV